MTDIITKAFNEISARTSLGPDTVRHWLKRAVEAAACECFGLQECEFDLDNRTVTPIFHVEHYFAIREAELFHGHAAVENNLLPVEFTFPMLPEDVLTTMFNRAMEIFEDVIREVESDQLEKRWRKQVHQAVEGVIKAKYPNRIDVNLGDDARGVMYKSEWTPLEMNSYREGKLLLFYVLKVARRSSGVDVHLSRGTPVLPKAILKTMAPWVKAKTIKRLRGKKTWLRISPPVTVAVLKEVSTKLNGEVIDTAPLIPHG